jgi:hypothetical protein
MRFPRRLLLTLVLLGGVLLVVDYAEAWGKRRHTVHRSSGARPVTGYGSNLHRRFVLKRELKRARQGKPVRSRGNIRWNR